MHYLMDSRDVSSSDGGRVVVDIYHVDGDTGDFVYVCRCYTFARLLNVVRNMRHAGMTEATYTEYGRFYTDYQHNCYN